VLIEIATRFRGARLGKATLDFRNPVCEPILDSPLCALPPHHALARPTKVDDLGHARIPRITASAENTPTPWQSLP
jgi:hypothetical protein